MPSRLTYLAIRMAIVVGLMAVIVAVARPAWPDRIEIAHSAVAGILVHGIYLGGTAVAICACRFRRAFRR